MKTGTRWKQLKQGDRDRIELMWKARYKQKDIAGILEVHPSRISREIENRKKKDGTYSATSAEQKAQVKRGNSKYQGMKIERNPKLRRHIVAELKRLQSPDAIAGRMKKLAGSCIGIVAGLYNFLRAFLKKQ